MDKDRSKEPPPLTVQTKRRVVATPFEDLPTIGFKQGSACQQHESKHQHIDPNEDVGG